MPEEPLYFLKAPNAYHPHGAPIVRPKSYDGRIIYEGELGVVIGKKCSDISEAEAGRSLETEALIGSILEMARLTETPAPAIESVYALVKLLNKVMLLEGGGVKVEKSKAA